jgi:hypothetical protein
LCWWINLFLCDKSVIHRQRELVEEDVVQKEEGTEIEVFLTLYKITDV